MDKLQLLPHILRAIEAIKTALLRDQNNIVVEMVSGCGKIKVLTEIIEYLYKNEHKKIVVVVGNTANKEQITKELQSEFNGFAKIDNDSIFVESINRLHKNPREKIKEYDVIIFYNVPVSIRDYETFLCRDKTVIAFFDTDKSISQESKSEDNPFKLSDIVYSYTLKDAIDDGLITPAMDERVLGPAVELFSKQLLKEFGFTEIDWSGGKRGSIWDIVVQNSTRKIWVECKYYKSQVVSPSVANVLLKTLIMRITKQGVSEDDLILLIVLSSIPSFDKDEIYKRHRIIVWDIENLVYYSRNNSTLLKQLAKITYFPIDRIEGQPSKESGLANLWERSSEDKLLNESCEETNKPEILIQRLEGCVTGREQSREFEEICEDIIRHLFEANYFNRLSSQHKTDDEHFRMDLIGALKINQNDNESMHPLWRMLLYHYNSHFVIFEFKNYSDEIDQNLIYITEKYLFDAALRNVAFIISRKGFSKAAKFAAEGCLKEHGKLILDITQEDLIHMLKTPSDNPADYLLSKLEDFLMGISK